MKRTVLLFCALAALAAGMWRPRAAAIRERPPQRVAILGDSVARGAGDAAGEAAGGGGGAPGERDRADLPPRPLQPVWDARLTGAFSETRGVTVVRVADLLDGPGRLSPVDRFHPSAVAPSPSG